MGNTVYYAAIPLHKGSHHMQALELLKKMLARLGMESGQICTEAQGKPYFADNRICFNYSHSRGFAACTLSDHAVGIDIEDADRTIPDSVAAKFLEGEPDPEKRLEKWVRLEAFGKMKGTGICREQPDQGLPCLLVKNDRFVCAVFSGDRESVFREMKIE